jgi:hypothetical protein
VIQLTDLENGQDLENDDEVYEATAAFFKIPQNLMVKIVQITYSETEKEFEMIDFPET